MMCTSQPGPGRAPGPGPSTKPAHRRPRQHPRPEVAAKIFLQQAFGKANRMPLSDLDKLLKDVERRKRRQAMQEARRAVTAILARYAKDEPKILKAAKAATRHKQKRLLHAMR